MLVAAWAYPEKMDAQLTLTLEKTITLAADSSLDAFRYKNMYLAGYWEYRSYKAARLPSLTLNLTPAQYYQYFVQRYDSDADIDVYRKQRRFYAGGGLEISQNFDLLGGTFYLDTDLDYMRYFGDQTFNQFSSVPVRIGYQQDLLGYNAFKWERKIEPLKFEKVKKEFLYNVEQISEQATTYFFALAMAQVEYDLAVENVATTDTLYKVGQERHKIAAINQNDLLTLKLDAVNARNTLQNAEIALKRAMFSLASYLNFDKNTEIRLRLPSRPRNMNISVDQALALARENNPTFLELKQEILHLIPADAAVCVEHKLLILQNRLKDLQQSLLPGLVGLLALERLGRVFHTGPLHQIVDILEMIVKRHTADTAVLRDIANGDPIQAFCLHHLF